MDPIVLIVYVVAVTLVLSLLAPRLREADRATRRRLWLFTLAGCGLFFVVLLLLAGTARGQDAPGIARQGCERARPGHVVVYGDVPEPLEVPLSAFDTLPPAMVRGTLHDGRTAKFEGVLVRELLRRAGVPDTISAPDLVRYVVAEAADGYRALYSLVELEPDFNPEAPILAVREDGEALAREYGPVQVIVPGERRHVRWVRQVQCLRVGTAP